MLDQLNDFSRVDQDLHPKHIEYCCRTCRSLKEIGAHLIKIEQESKIINGRSIYRKLNGSIGLIFTKDSMLYKAHITYDIAHEWGVYEDMIREIEIDNIIYDTDILLDMGSNPKTERTIDPAFLVGVEYVSKKKDGTPFKNNSQKVVNTSNELRAFLMNVRMHGKSEVAIDGNGLQYWLWDVENTESGEKFAMVMCKPYP